MRRILSRNPFTSQIYQEFDFLTNEQLEAKLAKAQQGFQIQQKRTPQERGEMIGKLGEKIELKRNSIAELITKEMGKPITESQGQVKKVVSFCQHFSNYFQPLHPTNVKAGAKKKTLIKYKPLGVIYFLVPFNFPFFLNFKGGLPNLLLGNCLMTRNSDSNPQLGELIEELMCSVGFDSGEYQNVFTNHDQLDFILSHQSVGGVSFTGSSRAGMRIAESAGKNLKKSVMELGGNDPFVVLSDANINLAINDAVAGRCRNAGQVCFSPKRFIIAKQFYEKFKSGLISKLQAIKYGDPMNEGTQMGPLARPDIYDNLADQLKHLPSSWSIHWQRSGIQKPFFPLTVLEGTDEEYNHETFGPVYSLFKADNDQHAVKLANSGTYGLGCSVYSEKRGEQVADRIRCGMAFINEVVKSDYMFPSGGVGRSGYGRECGTEGFKQFANIKVYYVS